MVRLPDLTTQEKRAALGGGIAYVLVLFFTPVFLGLPRFVDPGSVGAFFSVQVGPWLWWGYLGGALAGAVLAVSDVRYRLVSPTLAVVVVYAVATYETVQLVDGPYVPLPGTPYDLFLIGWPVVLLGAGVAGVVERRIRCRDLPESR